MEERLCYEPELQQFVMKNITEQTKLYNFNPTELGPACSCFDTKEELNKTKLKQTQI